MQQSLGKEKRNLRGFFLCCVFMKGQTLKLGSLGGTLEGSFKKKFQRSIVDLVFSFPLLMVVFSWVLLVFLVVVLLSSWCSWSCFLGFSWCFWFLFFSLYLVLLVMITFLCFVGVPSCCFLGLLVFMVILSWVLLVFLIMFSLVLFGVCGCAFLRLYCCYW